MTYYLYHLLINDVHICFFINFMANDEVPDMKIDDGNY